MRRLDAYGTGLQRTTTTRVYDALNRTTTMMFGGTGQTPLARGFHLHGAAIRSPARRAIATWPERQLSATRPTATTPWPG